MMDPESPFANRPMSVIINDRPKSNRIVHVNFCEVCHYVWKAPAAAKTCVNCKGNGECARSLVSYKTEVFIL